MVKKAHQINAQKIGAAGEFSQGMQSGNKIKD